MHAPTSSYGHDLRRARHSSFNGGIPLHAFHRGRDVERQATAKDDCTSASMGKFSDCLFQSGENSSISRPLSSKSDLSLHTEVNSVYGSSSSLPAFTKTASFLRRNSQSANVRSANGRPEKESGKRLVYQFLNLEDGSAEKPETQVSHTSRPSMSSSASQEHESLSHYLLCDLKDATALHDGGFRDLTCSGSKTTCTQSITLADELTKFDKNLRSTLADLMSKDQAMNEASKDLDTLQVEIHRIQQDIQDVQIQVAGHDVKVQSAFQTQDANSFISKLTADISSYSEQLTAFERHIGKCKTELMEHKATVHKFETTIKLNEMLRDSQNSMCVSDRLREYKGIITDLLALIMVIVVSVMLKRFLTHK
ncbi:LAFA_0C08966g1_1 [Lachancea sp. 'fantastica']|nr:LAFA_0C08966g1_1 [Lachancea sp. 'fantastica']